MPLSISSSEIQVKHTRDAQSAMFALVACLVILGAVAELASVWGLPRASRIQRRINAEASDSLHLPPIGGNGRPTLLLLGNSLLLEGVNFPELKTLVATRYDAHRFVIEQTTYLDWYFALKRIFRHGSRPSRVVLCLSVGQLMADMTRGDFTAHYAMDIEDLPELARREHLDATAASNLLFAHYSGWLGARTEMRKFFLARILPDAGALANVLGFQPAPLFRPELLRALTPGRLLEMQALCRQNGAEFVFLLPPVVTTADGSALLSQVGLETGVPVVTPVRPAEFSRALFRDGFHLNNAGAESFTGKLAGSLLNGNSPADEAHGPAQ